MNFDVQRIFREDLLPDVDTSIILPCLFVRIYAYALKDY